MTRINVGVKPQLLTDEHLLAEHREIKRLCFVHRKRQLMARPSKIPANFCLGTGHVLFFVDKPIYTFRRYCDLHLECTHRGFKVADYCALWWVAYPNVDFTDPVEYEPTKEDTQLIVNRIIERIENGKLPYYKYAGTRAMREYCIQILEEFSASLK